MTEIEPRGEDELSLVEDVVKSVKAQRHAKGTVDGYVIRVNTAFRVKDNDPNWIVEVEAYSLVPSKGQELIRTVPSRTDAEIVFEHLVEKHDLEEVDNAES